MTSKNLFFKLIKQDLQKRIWCPILIFIGCFLAFEVQMLVMFDKYEQRFDINLKEYVELRFFGTNTRFSVVLVCFAALLCAISGFSYLHSKVQIDTYHSLPVKRTQLFFSKYISGVMQFFFPFVFHIFVCMGIAAGKGAFSGEAFANAMRLAGVSVLAFLLVYAVFIIAVCLTGNLIVSIIGSGVLFTYSSLISLLCFGLFERFFHTYIAIDLQGKTGILNKFRFSPLAMLTYLFTPQSGEGIAYDAYFKYNAEYLWVIAAGAVVYTILACLLFQKRASESAGKAIAFRWAEPVLKTLIVIPSAFYAGLFFADLTSGNNDKSWFLFGVVFGYFIMALLMEIIFRLDIKSAFCHKRQLLFNAACVAVIFVIFRYDVLGYDTYVPADKELTSCAVSIDGLMEISPINRMGKHYVTHMDTTEYRMEHVAIQGNPSVMELARKAVADGYREENIWEQTTPDPSKEYHIVTFGYRFQNGKSVYRQYYVNIADAETKKLLADIFEDENYKIGTNPMLNSGWEQEFQSLICVGNACSAVLEVTPEFQSKLLETYREEYLQLDLDTVLNTAPLGGITLQTKEESEYFRNNPSFSDQYRENLIYPQFTKTIALLKENGFDIYQSYSAEEVSHIVVTYWKEVQVQEGLYSYTTSEIIEVVDTYDEEEKQQILDSILDPALGWQSNAYSDFYDRNFEVNIFLDTQGNAPERNNQFKYEFKKDMVPQFIYDSERYQEILKQQ